MTPQERIKEIIRINTSSLDPKSKIKALEDFVKKEKAEESQEAKNQSVQKVELIGVELVTIKGDKGDQGIKGEKGDKGEQGIQGIEGKQSAIPGPQGKQGLQGLPGKDGKDGINGKDGRDGVDGKNAEAIEIKTVIKEVLKSLKREKLHIKNIDGVDKFQEQIVHHAVTQARGLLYAGLLENKATAATGAGGYTVETPTGTVDGSNTTFTVTATPVYIVSDGTTYFENNGYTLSGLTITMSVPPTGYIRSFHI